MTAIRSRAGFTLIELMIVVAVLSIVAAIAIPNYLRYMAKSRQSEAKTNLGGIFVAETTFFGEQSRFSNFSETGFTVAAATNRYTYRSQLTALNTDGTVKANQGLQLINASIGGVEPENVTIAAGSDATGFTATATANLDNDPVIDQWHVNDNKQNLQDPDTNDSL